MTSRRLSRSVVTLSIPCILTWPACDSAGGGADATTENGGASSESEGDEEDDNTPDYGLVFDDSLVRTLRLTISAEDYAAMNADLADILSVGALAGAGDALGAAGSGGAFAPTDALGAAGSGGASALGALGAVPEEFTAACVGSSAGAACEASMNGESFSSTCQDLGGSLACLPEMQGDMPAMGEAVGAGGEMLSRDPMYVPVTVEMDGSVWKYVGMRYKGNSSLMSGYSSGNRKLPFRLDFDRYEDDWPETKNQRFHGFGKLTFASNFGDDSQIRECFADRLLSDSGLPVAGCAFYRVVIDVGNGDEYLGLYSVVEDPADGAFLDRAFGTGEGNLYKPEGTGATWTAFDEASFTKKTNEDEADYSDVQAAIDALHADRTDAARWRQELEKVFNVKGFLRWLAINTTIQNWDAYGQMSHNYYLYGVPSESGRLTWIPWDHNLSLGADGIGQGAMTGGNLSATESVLHTTVDGASWPLIRYLLDDSTYATIYREELESFLDGAFDEGSAVATARAMYELVAPHVTGANGEVTGSTTVGSPEAFSAAMDELAAVIVERRELVLQALDESTD